MPTTANDPDWAVRAQAFEALERLVVLTGGGIPWARIARGFEFEGHHTLFASRALGIFKPKRMSAALSIRTSRPRPGRASWYRDQDADIDAETGLLAYDLQQEPRHPSNEHLRLAFERRAPLIHFRAVQSAVYEAIWPVWVEDFRATEGRVLLAAADAPRGDVSSVRAAMPDEIGERKRSYSLATDRRRNHQAWFSGRTKAAYGYRCAFSGLPLGDLLVGAHIKADEYGGPASVTNGICMSTLHHAAFDRYLIGVDPELGIHVAESVIRAHDGPLLASLQALAGGRLRAPRQPEARPHAEFLEWRFSKFEKAEARLG